MFWLSVLIPLVAAGIGAIGTLINIGRLFRPPARRRISCRAHFDDRIGTHPDIKGMAELVVRRKKKEIPDASLVLIRLRNDGGLDIHKEHFDQPIIFTFPGRKVVGVEVKAAKDAEDDTQQARQQTLREMLLGHQHTDGHDDTETEEVREDEETTQAPPNTITFKADQLRLPPITLNMKDEFRLLVLLSGPGTGVDGSVQMTNAVPNGGLEWETVGTRLNRVAIRTLAWGGSVFLSLLALILVLAFIRPSPMLDTSMPCGAGTIIVSGSTEFAPAVREVAAHYMQSCRSATIQVNPSGYPTGSHAGVQDLATRGQTDQRVRAQQMAVSDGPTNAGEYGNLVPRRETVIIFSIVVNKATGVHSITTDQLRGIYSGQYTNWQQLGGSNLPIDIVSRGTESGTRSTFDQKALNGTEPQASSYNCVDRDIDGQQHSPVIRCELSSTDDLLRDVNTIPGAIGYAEMSATAQLAGSTYPQVNQVQLNDKDANPAQVMNNQYSFWTVEYIYTYGEPDRGLLLTAFLEYLSTDTAKSIMRSYGEVPCTDEQQVSSPLCR